MAVSGFLPWIRNPGNSSRQASLLLFPRGDYYHRHPVLQIRLHTISIRAGSISVWQEVEPPQPRPDWLAAEESSRLVHHSLEGSCPRLRPGQKKLFPCALLWHLAIASQRVVWWSCADSLFAGWPGESRKAPEQIKSIP